MTGMHPQRGNGEFDLSNPFRSFVGTAIKVVSKPSEFFGNIPRSSRLWPPLVFALTCNVIPLLVGTTYSALFFASSENAFAQNVIEFLAAQDSWAKVLLTLLIPPLLLLLLLLIATLVIYVTALILHLLVSIFARQNAGFEATFRVNAYASVVALVSQIPLVGFLASFYGIYLFWTGIQRLHSITARRAGLIVAVPVLFVAGLWISEIAGFVRDL